MILSSLVSANRKTAPTKSLDGTVTRMQFSTPQQILLFT
jgi:hypothetical protein